MEDANNNQFTQSMKKGSVNDAFEMADIRPPGPGAPSYMPRMSIELPPPPQATWVKALYFMCCMGKESEGGENKNTYDVSETPLEKMNAQ